MTHADLYRQVAHFAAALRTPAFAGDRVAAFMPNMPETVVAMFASTAIGAVFSRFAGFRSARVVDRFGQTNRRCW